MNESLETLKGELTTTMIIGSITTTTIIGTIKVKNEEPS